MSSISKGIPAYKLPKKKADDQMLEQAPARLPLVHPALALDTYPMMTVISFTTVAEMRDFLYLITRPPLNRSQTRASLFTTPRGPH